MAAYATVFSSGPGPGHTALQHKALTAYTEALNAALIPLAEHYQTALTTLAKVQEGYLIELGQRVNAAYQTYADTLTGLSAGSPHLESATESYNLFIMRYAEYADPNRWADVIAPAQKRLELALADAGQGENSTTKAQEAVMTFYQDLNDALRSDDILQELTDAQTHYVTEMAELQSDIQEGWHEAVATVTESLTDAATQTATAFDVNAALEDFATEIAQIAEDMTAAYETAAAAATEVWQDGTDTGGGAPLAGPQRPKPAPAPKPKPEPATPDKGKAAKAMAVGTASMPRASWVNVPEPPIKDASKSRSADKKPSAAAKPKRKVPKQAAAPKPAPSAAADRDKPKDD